MRHESDGAADGTLLELSEYKHLFSTLRARPNSIGQLSENSSPPLANGVRTNVYSVGRRS